MIVAGMAPHLPPDSTDEAIRAQAQALIARSREMSFDADLLEVNIREAGQTFESIKGKVSSGAVYEHGDPHFDSHADVINRLRSFVDRMLQSNHKEIIAVGHGDGILMARIWAERGWDGAVAAFRELMRSEGARPIPGYCTVVSTEYTAAGAGQVIAKLLSISDDAGASTRARL